MDPLTVIGKKLTQSERLLARKQLSPQSKLIRGNAWPAPDQLRSPQRCSLSEKEACQVFLG